MVTGILIGALGLAALVQQTDTLVQADGATRLQAQLQRGEVVVRTWDRDAVQVNAAHAPNRALEVRRSGRTLTLVVDAQRGRGPSGPVDLELTVPRGFDLDLEGMAVRVDIQGTEGNVEVTTIQGPIQVRGGRGSILLESVNGEITVEEARGNIRVNAVAGAITISGSSGDISAESVSGSITLEDIVSRQVEARTVSGPLRYEGSIEDGGRYTFGTHAGEVWLHLPGDMNARVSAVTLAGDIRVDFPGAPDTAVHAQGLPGLREKRLTFETGNASARVSVETFAGTLHILRR
jgi:DUF4097 and DUF4098 domain-containing protein YvlB